MTCIITGCRARAGNATVGGDLHLVGECFVFNAIVERGGSETAWTHDESMFSHYPKEIDFSASPSMYEKRGVLIAPMRECSLNEAARAYIGDIGGGL